MNNTSEYTVVFSFTYHHINNTMKKEYPERFIKSMRPGEFLDKDTSEFNKFICNMLNTGIIRLKRTYTINSDDSKTNNFITIMPLNAVALRNILREAFDDFLKENLIFKNHMVYEDNISLFKDTINHMNLQAHNFNRDKKNFYIILL